MINLFTSRAIQPAPTDERHAMKTFLLLTICTASLLLNGCASTVRSKVSSFNEWPETIANTPSYVFEAAPPSNEGIEYNQYLAVVGGELNRFGLQPAINTTPDLKVTLRYATIPIDIRVFSDPFASSFNCFPFSGSFISRRNFRGFPRNQFFFSSCVDPFRFNNVREEVSQRFFHKVKLDITRIADNKKLYEATVENTSSTSTQNEVIPFMLQSVFTRFPGKSGETFSVEIPANPK